MNSPWLVAIICSLFGGVVGSSLTAWMSAEDESSVQPRARRDPLAVVKAGANDDSRRDEQDARMRKLEHRITVLTAALTSRESERLDESEEAAPAEAKGDATDVADPVFEAAVLDIMDRERQRKEEEQATWRKQLHTERGRRFASELSDPLGLDAAQQAQIARVVTDYFEKWRALRDEQSPDRPATRQEWREQQEEMNRSADESVQAILSADQYEKYKHLDPEQQIGFGGRGRRPDSTPARN